ncbi:hypothetical protein FSW04_20900 [Baekduia soli]|uniref:Uncharacterized protein n=1 Tax=Baekduia soli TaxID=496014 RepID=A0A5B8U9F7_9ACTN|nr:hypothetical protein [Baekduia soli]QEC49786.1 hypothetical protein FSW04_20900 [Baekduia soli]
MTDLFTVLAEGDEPLALTRGLWARRLVMTLLLVVAVLALADVFGQRASRSAAQGSAASIAVQAPRVLRGGLLFQGRLVLHATRAVAHPRLVLDRGWFEGIQLSSISPDPASEAPRGDRVVLSYPALAAGAQMTIWFQGQVDPTSTGRRPWAPSSTTPSARWPGSTATSR